jgi:hypothetical protein
MINQLHSDVQKLETELVAYAAKPTKASSVRAKLIELDKAGY